MHGGHGREDEPMAEMNMVPLIDIALTLLIIMMVTSVFVRSPGFALNLPQAATRQGAPETQKDISIGVDKQGILYLDGKKRTEEEMLTILKAAYDNNHDVRVLVKGDRDVVYGKVSTVMDIVSQANITHVQLPTEPRPIEAQPETR